MLKSKINLGVERERLLSYMNQYLSALLAHDFNRIRFSPDLKVTENTRSIPVGSGLCKTIRSLLKGGHTFVDVSTGQVEYWGVADESGAQTIFGVRLLVAGIQICEVETLAVRNRGDYFFPDKVLAAGQEFHDVIPPEQRASRAQLIEAAERYFDGIELQNGDIVPATDNCLRLVNGTEDTITDVSGMAAKEAHRALTVKQQITEGHYSYIERLRARRYPLVDEERGLVLAHVIFDHPGDLKRADGMLPFKEPNSMLCYEVFKMRNGLLEAVWAIGGALPYGIDSGWGDGQPRIIDASA
jgi:hypothetical protein